MVIASLLGINLQSICRVTFGIINHKPRASVILYPRTNRVAVHWRDPPQLLRGYLFIRGGDVVAECDLVLWLLSLCCSDKQCWFVFACNGVHSWETGHFIEDPLLVYYMYVKAHMGLKPIITYRAIAIMCCDSILAKYKISNNST